MFHQAWLFYLLNLSNKSVANVPFLHFISLSQVKLKLHFILLPCCVNSYYITNILMFQEGNKAGFKPFEDEKPKFNRRERREKKSRKGV